MTVLAAAFSLLFIALAALAYFCTRAVGSRQRAEEAYRLLFEDASDAIATTTADLQFLEVNARACEMLGYSRAELLTMNVRDLLSAEEVALKPIRFDLVMMKKQTVVQERCFRRKDGTAITIELSVRAMRDGRLIAIGRDVTARRTWEDALKDSEAMTRSVIYTAVDGIVTADSEGIIRSFNPAAERMFGYAAEEVIGKNLGVLMPQPDRERHDGYIRAYLETGRTNVIGIGREVTALRKDGVKFPIELAVSEIVLPGRRMFTGIIHDLTARKLAEERLEETNAKLEAVIETSPVAVIAVDLEGRVTGWNAAAERMFGWSAGEAVGGLIPTVPVEERAEFLESLALSSTGVTLSGAERRRLRKDGSTVDVSVWTAPLRNQRGEVTGVLGIVADLTQRKALEEQFRHAQKMEAVGRLAGGIAHDFNNILTVITGYGQMLLDQAADEPTRTGMEEILKAAEHASALTGQLLVFSRRHVANQKTIHLGKVIARLERMLRRIIGEDIELITIVPEDLGHVRADASQIEQVVMNLAVNARDAMPGGGRLTLELANVELDSWYVDTHIGVLEGEYVMLAVSDTGKGIAPEARGRLFEPFFTTKERGKGTGLGLSTVYGIVKQSGGEIWVYSEPGKGTTLKIYLPRVKESEQAAEAPRETLVPARGAETILLVEDEPGVRALVREVLRQHGYRVLDASDVNDALRLCREHEGDIHLLLTDVVMPVMSGRELADRAAEIRPELRVLYMSGYTDNVVVHHGVTARDAQFLQKPFAPKLLARKVRDLLDRAE
ncbi:MAG: PAS domain S-box protein [Acidobacteriota bacterium]